jgi:potassium efflux system protein
MCARVWWLVVAGVLWASLAVAQELQSPSREVVGSFVQVKAGEMEALAREVDALQAQVDQLEPDLLQGVGRFGERIQSLEVVSRLVGSNPYDMRAALAEAQFLVKNMEKESAGLAALFKAIESKNATIASLTEDVERRWAATLDKELQADVLAIRSRGTKQIQNLQALAKRVAALQSQYDENIRRIWVLTERFQAELPRIWEREFLDAKPVRLWPGPESNATAEIQEWLSSAQLLIQSQLRALASERGAMAGVLLLFWLPFSVLGLLLYRHVAPLFPPQNHGRHAVTALAIAALTLALSLLAAFFSGRVIQTSLLLVLTNALMLGGAQALAWRIRLLDAQTPSAQPLFPLCLLFWGTLVLDMLRLPAWLFVYGWLVVVSLSSIGMGLTRPQFAYEKWIRHIHPWIAFVVLVVFVSGRVRLASLGGQLWCVAAVAGQGALAAIRLAQAWMGARRWEVVAVVVADALQSLFSLAVWTCMVLAILGWLAVQLGTNMVFERVAAWQLNWGEFSLNFLRLGLVFLLFHVVRSLASAWKVLLASDRVLPGGEHGGKASLMRLGIYCLWLLFGVVALHLVGVNLSNMAVIAGGLSVGIGFGLQNLINNFVSGIILLFDRSLRPGDIIQLDTVWAVVRSVNIRNTEVETFENATILIPNSELISNRLTNWTHKADRRIRRDILVGVAYGSDVARVHAVLLEAAEEHPAVLSEPAPQVIFQAFGASSLDFILRVWVRHISLAITTLSELHMAIAEKFREAGIEIAFPQLDIHVRDGQIQVGRVPQGDT